MTRPRNGLAAILLLVALTSAGCLEGTPEDRGPEEPDPSSPPSSMDTPLLELHGCTGAEFVLDVDSEWAAQQLPANETLAPNPQTLGTLTNTLLTFVACENHSIGLGQLGSVRFMTYAIGVEPADEAQEFHTYLRDAIIDGSPALITHWTLTSKQVREGTVSITREPSGSAEFEAAAGPDAIQVITTDMGDYDGSMWPIDRIWHHDDGSHWRINGTREQGDQTAFVATVSGYLEDALPGAPGQAEVATWITMDGSYVGADSDTT